MEDFVTTSFRIHRETLGMIKSLKERIGDFKSERTTSFGYKWTSVVKITQSDVVEMAVDALERELRARAADEASDARPLVG